MSYTETYLRNHSSRIAVILITIIATGWMPASGQVPHEVQIDRDSIISIAAQMMETIRFCALITLDSTGQPHVRTMDPFKPEKNMVVWLGTNPESRKVSEIRNDPRVTLYYPDPDATGYVTIVGHALLVSDPSELEHHWKEEWKDFYPDRKKDLLLIKVIPVSMDVLNYKYNLAGDPKTWRASSIKF